MFLAENIIIPLFSLLISVAMYFLVVRFVSWQSLKRISELLFLRAITAVVLGINILYILFSSHFGVYMQYLGLNASSTAFTLAAGLFALLAQLIITIRCPEELFSFESRIDFRNHYQSFPSRSLLIEESSRLKHRYDSIPIYNEETINSARYSQSTESVNNDELLNLIFSNFHYDQLNRSTNLRSLRFSFFLILIAFTLFLQPLLLKSATIVRAAVSG
jgi:hypothetical protein